MTRKKTTSTSKKRNGRRTVNATRGGTSSRKTSTRKKTSTSRKKTSSRKTRPSQREKTPPSPRFSLNLHQKMLLSGLFVSFFSFILILSFISPEQGELPRALYHLVGVLFGWGRYLVPIILGGVGVALIFWGMEQPLKLPPYRLAGLGILLLVLEAFATMSVLMRDNGLETITQIAQAESGGGYVGGAIAALLIQVAGNLGAIFILVAVGLLGAVLVSGVTRQDVGLFLKNLTERPAVDLGTPIPDRDIRVNPGRLARQGPALEPAVQLPLPEARTAPEAEPEAKSKPEPKGRRSRRQKPAPAAAIPETAESISPIFLRQAGSQNWRLPALPEMLESGTDQDLNNLAIREQVEIIEHTLDSFGAPATVVEINQGPTIVQFGVEPNFIETRSGKRTKVKVGKIASLADDLALALAAQSIRIQAPVPGKGYVGIEVPTPAKALVSLRDVMESADFQKIQSPLRIGLGQNVSGQPVAANLTAMPHLLIAGTTGSGKSVCVNGIIACLLLQNTPDQLKLVMVDPKRVELTGYNGIPHLAAPVVVEMDRVIGTLQWAQREMDKRYKAFADVGARNITDYNKKIKRHQELAPLPYVVIIIDELADLMMLAPEDTERAVTRLAQMARATGIHMVIATQRPSVDVVTGLIKANFPARIAFAVASSTDSRVVLDTTGAERLLGQGDMLFQSPDAATPVRLQGCFVSDEELNKLIAYWQTARRFNLIPAQEAAVSRPTATALPKAANTKPTPTPTETPESAVSEPTAAHEPLLTAPKPDASPAPSLQQPLWEELQALEAEQAEPEDELMPEAVALVRKLNKASTSLLQRRLRIGYTRAARLIDTMADQGIIGPPTGTSKAREVLPWQNESEANEEE